MSMNASFRNLPHFAIKRFFVEMDCQLHFEEKAKADCVAFIVFKMYCYYICLWLYLTVPWACLQYVIVVFPDHTHLLFNKQCRHWLKAALCSMIFFGWIWILA